mgnify:CR=1 FL=1
MTRRGPIGPDRATDLRKHDGPATDRMAGPSWVERCSEGHVLAGERGGRVLGRVGAGGVAGTRARIRDTRKTVPGLRALQKYAVRCGGGVNHRMSLGDAILVKDNHVAAAGSVTAALAAARAYAPDLPCELEVDSLAQLDEVLELGPDRPELVLLDNFTPDHAAKAVVRRDARAPGTGLEVSGGLTLDTAAAHAAAGVDFLAVGALTHSAPVLDLGLDLGM